MLLLFKKIIIKKNTGMCKAEIRLSNQKRKKKKKEKRKEKERMKNLKLNDC